MLSPLDNVSVFPTRVSALAADDKACADVVVTNEPASCFPSNAVCVAVEIGLARSDVLSTFPNPTSPFTNVTAPVLVATLVTTFTSAPASIPSSLVLSPLAKAPSEGLTCSVEIVTPFIPAKSVTSESIKAPAASTLVASVTSALVSIPSNLVPSADKSLPSTFPVTVIAPFTVKPANVGESEDCKPKSTAEAATPLVVNVTSPCAAEDRDEPEISPSTLNNSSI